MDEDLLPQFLRIGKAAKLLGVHPETLRRWEREGKIKSYRIGEKQERRFELEEILKLLEEAEESEE